MINYLVLGTIVLCWSLELGAQCASPPATGACGGGGGAVVNNDNINSGTTKWYSGSGTLSSVNVNGGTLRICGDLTLSNLNFNSGQILVESSGQLTINGSGTLFLNGNTTISNRGIININRSVTMQNDFNYIYNASGTAEFNMNSGAYVLEINNANSNFYNYGETNIYQLFIQSSSSAGVVCVTDGSCMNLTNINNNELNAFDIPVGKSRMIYTGTATMNQNLTGSSALTVCQVSGSSVSGGAGFGSATLVPDCSCNSVVLPIELVYFKAKFLPEMNAVEFLWQTATETDNDFFTIEYSATGEFWEVVERRKGAGSSNRPLNYSSIHGGFGVGVHYFRLRQTDYNGTTTVSDAVAVDTRKAHSKGALRAWPNPCSGTVHLEGNVSLGEQWECFDAIGGRTILKGQLQAGDQGLATIDLGGLVPGWYWVRVGQVAFPIQKQ